MSEDTCARTFSAEFKHLFLIQPAMIREHIDRLGNISVWKETPLRREATSPIAPAPRE